MKKTIYSKYDKGRIVVVLTERDAEKAVRYLLSQPILGIDTETRPSFKKGQTHYVALLQVSSHDVCFLFRLAHFFSSISRISFFSRLSGLVFLA